MMFLSSMSHITLTMTDLVETASYCMFPTIDCDASDPPPAALSGSSFMEKMFSTIASDVLQLV